MARSTRATAMPIRATCRSSRCAMRAATGCRCSVPIAGREVQARLWRAQVGHVSVYLLDTNVAGNSEADRDITFRLYGGDESHRIKQEMVLGIGGVRALRAAGPRARRLAHERRPCGVPVARAAARTAGGGPDASRPASKPWRRSACSPRTRPWPRATMRFPITCSSSISAACADSMGVGLERLLALGRAPGVRTAGST